MLYIILFGIVEVLCLIATICFVKCPKTSNDDSGIIALSVINLFITVTLTVCGCITVTTSNKYYILEKHVGMRVDTKTDNGKVINSDTTFYIK